MTVTRDALLADPSSGARALFSGARVIPAARPVMRDAEPEDAYRAGSVWESLRGWCTGTLAGHRISKPRDQGAWLTFSRIVLSVRGKSNTRHLVTIECTAGQWTARAGSWTGTGGEPVADELGALAAALDTCTDYPGGVVEVSVTRPGCPRWVPGSYSIREARELVSLARAHRAGVVLVRAEDWPPEPPAAPYVPDPAAWVHVPWGSGGVSKPPRAETRAVYGYIAALEQALYGRTWEHGRFTGDPGPAGRQDLQHTRERVARGLASRPYTGQLDDVISMWLYLPDGGRLGYLGCERWGEPMADAPEQLAAELAKRDHPDDVVIEVRTERAGPDSATWLTGAQALAIVSGNQVARAA